MAADVVQPGGAVEFVRQAADALVEQLGVLGRHRLPQQRHEGGVVGDLAFLGDDRVLAEVLDDLDRCDDGLGNEQHAGRRDLAAVLHQLQDQVRLAFVLAGGADLLPEEGHRVQAHDIRALVGPEKDDVQHLDEHGGVAVVEVPLVAVEDRHHPLAHGLVVGEIAGRGLRKDLGHGLLEHVRDVAVVENVVVVLVFLFALRVRAGPIRARRRYG